jgi:hypothetical protein
MVGYGRILLRSIWDAEWNLKARMVNKINLTTFEYAQFSKATDQKFKKSFQPKPSTTKTEFPF